MNNCNCSVKSFSLLNAVSAAELERVDVTFREGPTVPAIAGGVTLSQVISTFFVSTVTTNSIQKKKKNEADTGM